MYTKITNTTVRDLWNKYKLLEFLNKMKKSIKYVIKII